jgi:ribonuclease BN (tRNA processing enzyme)
VHSDHVTDLPTFLVQGLVAGGLGAGETPFRLYGPRERGAIPRVFPPGRPAPTPFNPGDPTPGTESMVRQMLNAFGKDINDRIFDAGSPRIDVVVEAHDISLPQGATATVEGPTPRMQPFRVGHGGWSRVARRLDRLGATTVVAGQDNMVIGAR